MKCQICELEPSEKNPIYELINEKEEVLIICEYCIRIQKAREMPVVSPEVDITFEV